jgi:hypothetical protein
MYHYGSYCGRMNDICKLLPIIWDLRLLQQWLFVCCIFNGSVGRSNSFEDYCLLVHDIVYSKNILYNVRVLDHFWPPVVRVMPLKTPFGLLIPLLQSQSHVTTITHNYFSCYATFTQLTIIHVCNYNHLFHSYTGWLLSYQLLSEFITDPTSSHFETLAEIWLREFTSYDCYVTTAFLTVTPGTELNWLTASLI